MSSGDVLTKEDLENIERAEHEVFVGRMQAANMKLAEQEYLSRLARPGVIPLLFSIRKDAGTYFMGPKRLGMLRAIWKDHQVELKMCGYNGQQINQALITNTSA